MNDTLRQYFGVIQICAEYYRSNQLLIDSFAHIKPEFELLTLKINDIISASAMTHEPRRKWAELKTPLRLKMEQECFSVMNSLLSFHHFNPTEKPIEGLNLSATRLKAMRELELLGHARRVQGHATEHVGGLAPYGTDAGKIASLATAADAFEDRMDYPKNKRADGVKARKEVEKLILECREILRKLDIFMRVLQFSLPSDYNLWLRVRRLGKRPTRHMALRVLVRDSVGRPIVGAGVVVLPKGVKPTPAVLKRLTRKTKTAGIIKYQSLADGPCTVTVTQPDGIVQTQKHTLGGKERLDAVFEMQIPLGRDRS